MAVTAIFFVEFILKVVAHGLIFNGPTSYLRSYWNILDLVILITSIVSYALE